MATTFEDLSRQRMDFSVGPRGETVATLTVSLGDGSVHRYRASTDDDELDQLAAAFGAAEVKSRSIAGHLSEDEISGIFSSIGKAFKSVVNVAKKVAASKVFKGAAKGLAMAAPALGPFAPAAMGVSGAMGVASKLATAAVAAEAGAKRAAKTLAKKARKLAKRLTRGKRRATRTLMSIANRKRKGAARLAGKRKRRGRRPKLEAMMKRAIKRKQRELRREKKAKRQAAARGKVKRPSVLRAARAGRLRSNKPGKVRPSALRKAARRGRIFWVQ